MVNNKIAQRAVAAGLSGLMAFGAAAPAALATSADPYFWIDGAFRLVTVDGNDDSDHWKRIGGDDRYDTMKKIVEAYNEIDIVGRATLLGGITTNTRYAYHSTAVLASGDNFPDALAANGLAGYLTNENLATGTFDSVPVILTKQGTLVGKAEDLLKNMQVQNVIIMGGTAAISQDVENKLNDMGIGTQRVAGADRQETSLKALQRINGNWDGRKGTYDLIIATGDNYADALSIAPYAYRMGTPVLLTKKDGTLTDAQVEAIKKNDKIQEVLIVGGKEAVSDQVMGQIGSLRDFKVERNGTVTNGINYTRIAGADRYETSAKIAQFEINEWKNFFSGFTFDHAVVARGDNFPDALAGGQLAGGVTYKNAVEDLWDPCPLLLVQDGHTDAERLLTAEIARYDVTVGTDVYTSFNSWRRTLDANYGNSTAEYLQLVNRWFALTGTKYIKTSALRGSNQWRNRIDLGVPVNGEEFSNVELRFKAGTEKIDKKISIDKVVWLQKDNSTGTVVPKDVTEDWKLDADGVTIVGVSNSRFTQELDPTKNHKEFTVNVDGNNYEFHVDYKVADVTAPVLDYIKIDGVEVEGLSYNWKSNKIVDANGNTIIDLYGAITFDDDSVVKSFNPIVPNTVYKFTYGELSNDDELIIAYSGTDEDFYGIILGGTKAVTNDKRDDLEDAVKATAGYGSAAADGLLSDLVTLNENEYVRLLPEFEARTLNGQTAYVYSVVGKDDYVLYTPDGNTWTYFYGGPNNTAYKALPNVTSKVAEWPKGYTI